MKAPRSAGVLLLLAFLAAHLLLLPGTLEDIDSVNFALGVRHFDVSRHQPHPPGYPVFIALAKGSTALLHGLGVGAPAPRGLAIWSAIGATAALPALLIFFTALESRRRVAWWTTVVIATAPLFWFTALRPLSDMAGFAAAIWALALLSGPADGRRAALGALIAGIGTGIRSQTAVLTLPFLLYTLVRPSHLKARERVLVALSFAAGGLAWGIPLLVVSGGLGPYLTSLGAQAGEDFAGVTMLWTQHSPRQIAVALGDTFLWPWDWRLGIGMIVLAAAGLLRIGWRTPRAVLSLAIAFGPYAVFHLLFQETVTTRYALPLVAPVAYCAIASLETRSRLAMPSAAVAIGVVSMLTTLPASVAYAADGAPIFQAFDDMAITAHGGERVDAIGMHASARRASEWVAPILPAPVARGPHGHEWLALVQVWRSRPDASVWFAADPRRTDLALFDPRARDVARAYRWGFVEPPFVGGARPDNIDWYHMRPPGWMLDRGWALTAEVGGVTSHDGVSPSRTPSIAWIRSRPDAMTVVLGGRLVAPPGAAGEIRLSIAGTRLTSFAVSPGFFARVVPVEAGRFSGGNPYLPLAVSAAVPADTTVTLEQFDAAGPGAPMLAYEEGWQEPEYNPMSGLAWRWMSEHATLWVRPIGRDVTLHLAGESTRKYYAEAPQVRILAGSQEIGSFEPSEDFDRSFTIPAAALAAADGRLTFVSSAFFVPGAASGGDQRHLAVRIFSAQVD